MPVMPNQWAGRPGTMWHREAGMASGDSEGHGGEPMHERVRRAEENRRVEDGARRAAEKAFLEVSHAKLAGAYDALKQERDAAIAQGVPKELRFAVDLECARTPGQHLVIRYFGREVARITVSAPEGDFRVEEMTGERRVETVPTDDPDRLKNVVADMLAAHRRAFLRRDPHNPISNRKPGLRGGW
jgi:hypothetical protein